MSDMRDRIRVEAGKVCSTYEGYKRSHCMEKFIEGAELGMKLKAEEMDEDKALRRVADFGGKVTEELSRVMEERDRYKAALEKLSAYCTCDEWCGCSTLMQVYALSELEKVSKTLPKASDPTVERKARYEKAAASIEEWSNEPGEFAKYECYACRGLGKFDEYGKPTVDARGRDCTECDGTGEDR